MNSNAKILNELNIKETQLGLYDETVFGFPIWRIIRFETRINFLKSKTGHTNRTKHYKPNYTQIIKFFLISTFQLASLIFKKDFKKKNVFFAFPRLIKIDKEYFDRFIDPIIALEQIKDDVLIFQRSVSGNYFTPRMHNERVVYTDFIEITSKILAVILIPILSLFFLNKTYKTFRNSNKIYRINFIKLIVASNKFVIEYFFYRIIYFLIKPNNVFLVNREIFFPQLLASKKLNIPVFELQHGITRAETALYTGIFNRISDPDKLLVFGKTWINPYFGLPEESIVNIGWAYKEFVKNLIHDIQVLDNFSLLVISSPAITQKILDFILKGIEFDQRFKFSLRLHPQEALNSEQLNSIKGNKNITIVDNEIDSVISISEHKLIIGDNSSVLYEALSMGKIVARINMLGIFSRDIDTDKTFGLNIISDFKDLVNLAELDLISETIKNDKVYSDFNRERFKQLTKYK